MDTDVKASTVAATGTVVSGRVRIRGLAWDNGNTGGAITIRDGGASGTTVLTFVAPGAAGFYTIDVPSCGILCATDVHATLAADVGSLVVFYG